jgi:mono/diheme cytochrome c family protein
VDGRWVRRRSYEIGTGYGRDYARELCRHRASKDAKVTQGQKVYTDQKCSLCHSIGGHGNAKGPLDNVGSKLSADEIKQWITDAKTMTTKSKATRKPEMKQYSLPPADVDALVAYLQSQKGK